MGEKVTMNLGFFLLPLPARTIPSPTLIIPFPLVNKLPNKLAPNVQITYLKILLFAL